MLLLSAALLVLGLTSAVLSAWQQIDPRKGTSLGALLVVFAAVVPVVENHLRERERRAVAAADRLTEQDAAELTVRAAGVRADLLEQVRRHWVETELEPLLAELPSLRLRFAHRLEAVDNPLRSMTRRPAEKDRPAPTGFSIEDVYQSAGRRLLVLGDAGAGKTTLLLALTRTLVDEALQRPDAPLPVVFHLSAWATARGSLSAWLVAELQRLYDVTPRLGRYLMRTEQIVPLLDGLDEVAAEHRPACIEAINRFHDEHGQGSLVICSRTDDYESMPVRLRLRDAVVIQPLTSVDVDRYLRRAGRSHAGLRALLREDDQLRELVRTPLWLGITSVTYRGQQATAVRASGGLEDRRQRVLADYVRAMLDRPRLTVVPPAWSDTQTVSWLSWLARGMRSHGQSLFHIDRLQPDWLPRPAQRRLVTMVPAIGAGLASGLVAATSAALTSTAGSLGDALGSGLGSGLVFGSIVGLFAWQRSIVPTDRLRWSLPRMLRSLPRLLGAGLLAGLFLSLVFDLVYLTLADRVTAEALIVVFVGGPVTGSVLGALAAALALGPVSGFEPRLSVTPTAPGMGMRTSARNAAMGGLAGGLSGAVVGGLLGVLIGQPIAMREPPNASLLFGLDTAVDLALVFGVIAALRQGGGAVLRHRVLLAMLVRHGCAPARYVAFLDHTVRLALLRRRGGGYEFVHRLLLDHFADLAGPDSRGGSDQVEA